MTIIDRIEAICANDPHRTFVHCHFDNHDARISYEALFQSGFPYLSKLREHGCDERDVVLVVSELSPSMIFSWFGIVMGGSIPSIFAPPSPKISPDRYRSNLNELIRNTKARFVVLSKQLLDYVSPEHLTSDDLTFLVQEDVERDAAPTGTTFAEIRKQLFRPDPTKLFLLQHTSGTTGLNKGVALSNESILNQLDSYSRHIDISPEDVIVSWLPLYHDMGLIACFIMPVTLGIRVVLMSPFDWVKNPKLLLDKVKEYRGTYAWLPNFAYNFIAQRVRNLDEVDLSSIRFLVNCSEPVSQRSHDLFLEKFQAKGLRREALTASYAMAENTFAVTQNGIADEVRVDVIDGRVYEEKMLATPATPESPFKKTVVSQGRPIAGTTVRIVDDSGLHEKGEREIGEIAIRSNCMLTGYHNNAEATEKAIRDGWFLSGDLGYLADGELYVIGRKKDMLIVGGKNIYPQDIENVISEVAGVHPGRVVVIGRFDEAAGTEEMVVAVERDGTEVDDRALRRKVFDVIAKNTDVVASKIVIVPHLWLIKSTSGKISRKLNLEKLISKQLL